MTQLSKSQISSLSSVMLLWKLKEKHCLEALKMQEKLLSEQQKLIDNLVLYDQEYFQKLSNLNQIGIKLDNKFLAEKTSILAMREQLLQMRVIQENMMSGIKIELEKCRVNYIQARLSVENLEKHISQRKKQYENEREKRLDIRCQEDYLTRFS